MIIKVKVCFSHAMLHDVGTHATIITDTYGEGGERVDHPGDASTKP